MRCFGAFGGLDGVAIAIGIKGVGGGWGGWADVMGRSGWREDGEGHCEVEVGGIV